MRPPSQKDLSTPEISVVIPVYNEEENLPLLAAEIQGAMRSLGRPYEVERSVAIPTTVVGR